MSQVFTGSKEQVSGCGNWCLPCLIDWRIIKGSWTITASTSYWGAFALASDAALGSAAEWDLYLEAGTYTLAYLYAKGTTQGIHKWFVDGTQLSTTIDAYAASASYNNRAAISNIVIATTGKHTLRCTSNTKNASSTDFDIRIAGIAMWRTA